MLSVSALALASASTIMLVAQTDAQVISFVKAEDIVLSVVNEQLMEAQEKFGFKYTEEEAVMIRTRLWDTTHTELRKYYLPTETAVPQ